MHGDQFMLTIQPYSDGGGLEPEGLPHEAEGHGVQRFFELHVSIAMDLDLRPDSEFWWSVR